MALQAMLVSPRFLFRLEQAPAAARDAPADLPHQRSGSGVAPVVLPVGHGARRRAAEGGERRRAAHAGRAREAGARACWPIARSEALSTRFAAQWLRLQDLEKIHPGLPAVSRSTTTRSAQAMKRETELFFDSIVREDRSVLDLLTADYTFVNERLAQALRHPERHRQRRSAACTLPEYRRGLLGQGSILTLTSVADRTSPVLRGKWVMEVLLGIAAAAAAAERAGARRHARRRPAARCCRRASAWRSTARTRRARRATA